LRKIGNSITAEKRIPVEYIIAPGNHDCDFSGDLAVRQSVLDSTIEKAGKLPQSYIDEATKVQRAFFEFRKVFQSQKAVVFEDPLWTSLRYEINKSVIFFEILNASWMSSKHEQQGGILFPFERYKDRELQKADLRMSVLHHPLNWYNKANYLDFRTFIRSLSDILVSGHEHQSNVGVIDDAQSGECAYVEGAALQERGENKSGFNIVQLNIDENTFACEKFDWATTHYVAADQGSWFPFRALPKRAPSELAITAEFKNVITDPGATLKHPDKRDLLLDDIYVFPDLDSKISGSKNITSPLLRKKNSSSLANWSTFDKGVILEGTENAGKTRLLFKLFAMFHGKD
jgi:hypothetical protein